MCTPGWHRAISAADNFPESSIFLQRPNNKMEMFGEVTWGFSSELLFLGGECFFQVVFVFMECVLVLLSRFTSKQIREHNRDLWHSHSYSSIGLFFDKPNGATVPKCSTALCHFSQHFFLYWPQNEHLKVHICIVLCSTCIIQTLKPQFIWN